MADSVLPAGVDALYASLKEQGGPGFDPAGWHYLETLAQGALAHEGTVRRLLEEKLERAATAFAERLARARAAAAGLLDAACKRHPPAADELRRLHAGGELKAMKRLCASLEATEQCVALRSLVAQLEPAPAVATARPSVHHAGSPVPVAPTLDLKTVRESRATWARLSVDRQLSQALRQAPKNAGPINSHMLVLRALEMMQSIAPDYLNRTVSYVDTLLLLDPGEVIAPVKRKKAAPAKPGKVARTAKRA